YLLPRLRIDLQSDSSCFIEPHRHNGRMAGGASRGVAGDAMPHRLTFSKQLFAGREFHKAPAVQRGIGRLQVPAMPLPDIAGPRPVELTLMVEAALDDRPEPPSYPRQG